MLYYISILLVSTALVSGIIIDAFAELRALNDWIRNDIQNVCFVCGMHREEFERLGLDFRRRSARARCVLQTVGHCLALDPLRFQSGG